ncbi:MAG: hypothetical protein IMY75_12215 [Chloroflexi bacterium]|nr:hypothetical protein [Chloroflexota bacterium]
MVRTLSPRGYHIAQCTKPGKLGESVPVFKSTPVTHEYLLHEQVEKVLFLWGGDGIDDPLEIDKDLLQDHTFLVELLDLCGKLLDSLVAGYGGHAPCLKGMEVPV